MKTKSFIFIIAIFIIQESRAQSDFAEVAGTWKLVKFINNRSDGTIGYPLGEDATGLISYDDKGNFVVALMRSGRPKFAGERGTAEEVLAASNGFIGYGGTCTINVKTKQLMHHTEVALNPGWLGQNSLREYVRSNNQLIMRTLPKGTSNYELVLEKLN